MRLWVLYWIVRLWSLEVLREKLVNLFEWIFFSSFFAVSKADMNEVFVVFKFLCAFSMVLWLSYLSLLMKTLKFNFAFLSGHFLSCKVKMLFPCCRDFKSRFASPAHFFLLFIKMYGLKVIMLVMSDGSKEQDRVSFWANLQIGFPGRGTKTTASVSFFSESE